MCSVSVNGFEMNYVEHGDGPPVVFVHGSLNDHRAWGDTLTNIAQDHRVIAPDLRYCGTADWPDGGEHYSIQTHSDDLATFISALTSEPVTLVGWSYGGSLSFVVAAHYPGLVARMFLYEPSMSTFVEEPEQVKTVAVDRAAAFGGAAPFAQKGDFAGAVRAAADGLHDKPGFFDGLPPTIQSMFQDNVRTMPLSAAMPAPPNITPAQLRSIDIPVEICFGSNTRRFFKIVAQTAAEFLPNAEARIIEDAFHLWPALEADEFSNLLREFLAGRRD